MSCRTGQNLRRFAPFDTSTGKPEDFFDRRFRRYRTPIYMRLAWAIAVVCAASGPAFAQWDPEKTMTNTGSDVWGEGIATSGTTVHMIYGTGVIMHRGSTDEGATWSNERQIGS